MNLPEHKVIEMSKDLIHQVRTHMVLEKDSKGRLKPKVSVEITRETHEGDIEVLKQMIFEQLDVSKEAIEQKMVELELE